MPFKYFMKSLKASQKVHATGWIKEDVKPIFTIKNVPKYFLNLPVKSFSVKDNVVKVKFAFSDLMFK